MILEVARIKIAAGKTAAFEAGVAEAAPLFARAKGCHSMRLHRVIEQPGDYVLMVEWETLEDHTVHFRGSGDFQAWRALVSSCFAAPPVAEHLDIARACFG